MTESTVYDEVPYVDFPYAQTHPERSAVVGMLRGLRPASPRRGRVLELGCGAGGNLLGIAAAAPELQAIGVDLATTAIERASEIAKATGLDNVDQTVAFSNTVTLSPRTVNETRAQFAYSDLKALPTDPIGPGPTRPGTTRPGHGRLPPGAKPTVSTVPAPGAPTSTTIAPRFVDALPAVHTNESAGSVVPVLIGAVLVLALGGGAAGALRRRRRHE